MHGIPELPKYTCGRCGANLSSPGACIACSMLSPYEKGRQDGRDSVLPKIPLHKPPKIEMDLRTDYKRGFDAGKRDALGCPGRDGFTFVGL